MWKEGLDASRLRVMGMNRLKKKEKSRGSKRREKILKVRKLERMKNIYTKKKKHVKEE